AFLKVASNAKEQKLWGPFVDNLFSSTELAIQSRLLVHHYPGFATNQSHDETIELFSGYAENGNIDLKFKDHYKSLDGLRKRGRYLNGLHGKDFRIEESEA